MCSVFHCGCGGKKEKEVVVKMKKVETQAKGGQALSSDRDDDHVGACPAVLQWDCEKQRGGLGCRGSNGEDTFTSQC